MPVRMPPESITAEETRLRAAVPEGWYVGPLAMEVQLDPYLGRRRVTYMATVQSGRTVGSRFGHTVGRRLDVDLSAPTIEGLEAALQMLTAFEVMFTLPIDTEVKLASGDDG